MRGDEAWLKSGQSSASGEGGDEAIGEEERKEGRKVSEGGESGREFEI